MVSVQRSPTGIGQLRERLLRLVQATKPAVPAARQIPQPRKGRRPRDPSGHSRLGSRQSVDRSSRRMPRRNSAFLAGVNASSRYSKCPVFSRPLMAGFGCPPRGRRLLLTSALAFDSENTGRTCWLGLVHRVRNPAVLLQELCEIVGEVEAWVDVRRLQLAPQAL